VARRRGIHDATREVRRLAVILGFESVRDLCRRERLNQSTVCRVLRGAPTRPATRAQVAAALRMSVEDLEDVLARARSKERTR
jgi:hypothetical protein